MGIVDNLLYQYRTLFDDTDRISRERSASEILSLYSQCSKSWTLATISEWTCRMYLAAKMILNATVLINGLQFVTDLGMRIANPYLEYYAVLCSMRAVVFTLPTQKWSDGSLMEVPHSKAINVSFDWLAKINRNRSSSLKKITLQLRAQRELISYRVPASGDENLGLRYDLIALLTVLVELAQFNSELLEKSVSRNAKADAFAVDPKHIHQLSNPEIQGYSFYDREDAYRLDYIRRKLPRPYNLASLMTEGQVEDFFGAWEGKENNSECFKISGPLDWQVIFDIP